jgi:hypothetical protein
MKSDGSVLNPITKDEPYIAYAPNRRARRASLNEPRFINNRAGIHLTVVATAKYRRVRQRYLTTGGEMVTILHYLEM